MRNIRAILALAAVLSVAAAARADSIKLANGLTYDKVTVTSVAEGVIVFRIPTGNALTKPVKELGVVSLDGMDAFNRAEAARAKGEFKPAADGYAEAAKGAAGWKESLIRCRQLDVAEGAEQTGEAYGIWIELMDAAATPAAAQATLALRPKKLAAANSPANNSAIALLEARLKVAKDAYLTGVRQALSELYERQGRMADATAMAELLAGNAPGPKLTDTVKPPPTSQAASAPTDSAEQGLTETTWSKALSSPEALGRMLSDSPKPPVNEDIIKPPDNEDLTTLQKQQAEKEYQARLALTTLQKQQAGKEYQARLTRWQMDHDPTGKEVTWVLRVVDVAPATRSEQIVVSAESKEGILVKANFSADQKETLGVLKKGQLLAVTGTIQSLAEKNSSEISMAPSLWNMSITLKGKAVAAANSQPTTGGGGGRGPKVRFFKTDVTNAYHICYVMDRSGSMLETFDEVKKEMLLSISRLTPDQTFHVIFFAEGAAKENEARRLVPGSPEYKKNAANFLKTIQPAGQTDPEPALKRAFEVLAEAPGGKGKIIYLLTDGEFRDNDKVLKYLAAANADKSVKINTILCHHKSPGAMKVLEQIAKENGGVFKFVEAE